MPQGRAEGCCDAYFGPAATAEHLCEQLAPVLECAARGCNGALICYGSGGRSADSEGKGGAAELLRGVAQRLFEHIAECSEHGDVFGVQVSFIEFSASSAGQDRIRDLLVDEDRELQVTADPLKPGGYSCGGAERMMLCTAQQLCDASEAALKRSSERGHRLCTLSVEGLLIEAGKPVVRQGKLAVVDLDGLDDPLSPDSGLASLGAALSQKGGTQQGSALTMLLRDCLCGDAQVALVGSIAQDGFSPDACARTLAFVHHVKARRRAALEGVKWDPGVLGLAAAMPLKEPRPRPVSPSASSPSRRSTMTTLEQLKKRNADVISQVQQKLTAIEEQKALEREQIKQEVAKVRTAVQKAEADKAIEALQEENLKKIEEVRDKMAEAMSNELQRIQKESMQDLGSLKETLNQRVTKLNDERSSALKEELHESAKEAVERTREAQAARKEIEQELRQLRVRLASTQERVRHLEELKDDNSRERACLEEDRRSLRQKNGPAPGEDCCGRKRDAEGKV